MLGKIGTFSDADEKKQVQTGELGWKTDFVLVFMDVNISLCVVHTPTVTQSDSGSALLSV